jgi:hypothetical protein
VQTATDAMGEALEGLRDNASYLSLVEGSNVQVLNAQTNGQFFMDLLEYFQRLMFMAFMVPETLFQVGRGGLGNAGLAEAHQKIMMRQLRVIGKQTKDQLKEKMIRTLIDQEFGQQADYGDWPEPEQGEENRVELFSAISNAIAQGSLSNADIEVVNRQRTLAGISPVSEIAARIAPTIDYNTPQAA